MPSSTKLNDNDRELNFAVSSRNVMGATRDSLGHAWWIPSGLQWSNDPKNPPPAYKSPFFGAQKAWENDDQGWTVVSYSHKKKNRARRVNPAGQE